MPIQVLRELPVSISNVQLRLTCSFVDVQVFSPQVSLPSVLGDSSHTLRFSSLSWLSCICRLNPTPESIGEETGTDQVRIHRYYRE